MDNAFLTPIWFFNYELGLDLASFFITALVSFFAYKIYKLTGQRQAKLFSISFFLISLSYLIQFVINEVIYATINSDIDDIIMSGFKFANFFAIYVYMTLFISALVILVYMSLNVKKGKVLSLLLILSALTIFFCRYQVNMFYLLSSILLLYIISHYLSNFWEHRQTKTLLVLVAFIFFFLSSAHFLFSTSHVVFFVIGNFLELLGSIFILINLLMVTKK